MLGGIKVSLAEDELGTDIGKEVFCPIPAIDRIELRACYALCMVVGTLEVWNENLTPVMLVMTNGPLWPPT